MRIELLSMLLRHRRAVVLGALATVTAAAWAYLLLGGGIQMEAMDMGGGQMMAMLPTWSAGYAALISVMWWAMMVAMMLPTAAPTVLLVTSLAWDRRSSSYWRSPDALRWQRSRGRRQSRPIRMATGRTGAAI